MRPVITNLVTNNLGFVAGRGSNMATSFANNKIKFVLNVVHQFTLVHWTQWENSMLSRVLFSGLQHIIDVANKYITENGLRFNSSKTECTIFGNCNLAPRPEWMLNSVNIKKVTVCTI